MFTSTIEITDINKIHEANLASVGKSMKAGWKHTREWTQDQLHGQHSTLEWANIYIKSVVSGTTASHVVRATKGHPRFVVESHRPDWTGKSRPPASAERILMIKCTAHSWIEICRQRLCFLASEETRKYIDSVCKDMILSDNIFLNELGVYSAPDCIYRGNICHQRKSCGLFPHWKQ